MKKSRHLFRTAMSLPLSFTLLLPLLTASAAADTQRFRSRIDQPFTGSQSPDDARMAAVAKAKFETLEKAGTYMESLAVVEKNVLTRDEITAIAAGILKTVINSQKNYATDHGFGIILETEIEVDTGVLDERIRNLSGDRPALKKHQEVSQREKELLDIIRKLEEQNKDLLKMSGPVDQERRDSLNEDLHMAVKALPAAEWNRKAIDLWHKGGYSDPQQALRYLNESIRLDPKNPKAYNNRGAAYFSMGAYEQAVRDYDEAVRLDGDYADALNNRGITLFRLRRYKPAVTDFDRVTALKPNWVEAYLHRAECYKNLWQYDRALENYTQATRITPAPAESDQNRDSALIILNEIDELCNKARKACKLGLCDAMLELDSRGFCQ
ncbi:MAG: tetratricopeptide repeat protein [Thermodesulfobacteriota bacterium]